MNRQDLVEKLMTKTRATITKADANRIIDGFMDEIIGAVADGETVSLVGLGTFKARSRAAREAHNPQTGEKIIIPAKKVPVFKPGKAFKEAVNG